MYTVNYVYVSISMKGLIYFIQRISALLIDGKGSYPLYTGGFANSEDPDEMLDFIRVYTIWRIA